MAYLQFTKSLILTTMQSMVSLKAPYLDQKDSRVFSQLALL